MHSLHLVAFNSSGKNGTLHDFCESYIENVHGILVYR